MIIIWYVQIVQIIYVYKYTIMYHQALPFQMSGV